MQRLKLENHCKLRRFANSMLDDVAGDFCRHSEREAHKLNAPTRLGLELPLAEEWKSMDQVVPAAEVAGHRAGRAAARRRPESENPLAKSSSRRECRRSRRPKPARWRRLPTVGISALMSLRR